MKINFDHIGHISRTVIAKWFIYIVAAWALNHYFSIDVLALALGITCAYVVEFIEVTNDIIEKLIGGK